MSNKRRNRAQQERKKRRSRHAGEVKGRKAAQNRGSIQNRASIPGMLAGHHLAPGTREQGESDIPVIVSAVRIEQHPEMVIAGVSSVRKLGDDFTPAWDELNQKASPAILDILKVTQYIGVSTHPSTDSYVRYTAGILVRERDSAAKLGLGVLELPASTYAVVDITGPIHRSIPAGFAVFERDFFPTHRNYRPLGGLEVYSRGDMQAHDYSMELWVPLAEVSV